MEVGKNNLELNFLGHSGFSIKGNKNIVIDPYNVSDNVDKADIVLITHCHYDHCSIRDIEKVMKPGTIVIGTPDCQSKITKLNDVDMQIVEVGDKIELPGSVKIETIAAYNKDKEYHPKSEGWVGYLIKIGNTIIYHAGDTDFIPEIQKLSGYGKKENEFIALLPVSGKSVMDPEDAAEAASVLSADLTIPMHYGAGVAGTLDDAQRFVELCKSKGLNSIIMDKV